MSANPLNRRNAMRRTKGGWLLVTTVEEAEVFMSRMKPLAISGRAWEALRRHQVVRVEVKEESPPSADSLSKKQEK
jgi:hypothetical protein